jgi:putative addiction module component (TIGR02574 family)
MHGAREIIQEATALPVEERALIIDSLLRSLNMPDREIENEWITEAQRRLAELRSGKVRAIPGDEVFTKLKLRFAT